MQHVSRVTSALARRAGAVQRTAGGAIASVTQPQCRDIATCSGLNAPITGRGCGAGHSPLRAGPRRAALAAHARRTGVTAAAAAGAAGRTRVGAARVGAGSSASRSVADGGSRSDRVGASLTGDASPLSATAGAAATVAAGVDPTTVKTVLRAGIVAHSISKDKVELLSPGLVGVGYDGTIKFCTVAPSHPGTRDIVQRGTTLTRLLSNGLEETIDVAAAAAAAAEEDAHGTRPAQPGAPGTDAETLADLWRRVAPPPRYHGHEGLGSRQENLGAESLLVPGFVDAHAHAPQYFFAGTGTDLPLLEWLRAYAFPAESNFEDPDFAEAIYARAVRRHLRGGTTTVSYFATQHPDGTRRLADVCERLRQRAFIGKVNMDRNNEDYYTETTEASLRGSIIVAEDIAARNNDLLKAIITPRFVPSCTGDLMRDLAQVARDFKIPVQSHISENQGEVEWVKSLHPECGSYAEVYDKYGLFDTGTPVLMAHGIYLNKHERELMAEKKVGVAHCPVSNFNVGSGILDVKRLQASGVAVGLGTDVAGGHMPHMLESIRSAILAAKLLAGPAEHVEESSTSDSDSADAATEGWRPPLSMAEAFWMATEGGAKLMGLQDTVGNFESGKEFDATLVDLGADVFDAWHDDSPAGKFSKWLYLGEQANISRVYVKGGECPL